MSIYPSPHRGAPPLHLINEKWAGISPEDGSQQTARVGKLVGITKPQSGDRVGRFSGGLVR